MAKKVWVQGEAADNLMRVLKPLGMWHQYLSERDQLEQTLAAAGEDHPKIKACSQTAMRFIKDYPPVRDGFRNVFGVVYLRFSPNRMLNLDTLDEQAQTKAGPRDDPTECQVAEWIDPRRFKEPPGTAVDKAAAVDWVAARLSMPLHLVKPEECPNGFAWAMWVEAVKDKAKFIKDVCGGIKKVTAQEETDRGKKAPPARIMDALDRIGAGVGG